MKPLILLLLCSWFALAGYAQKYNPNQKKQQEDKYATGLFKSDNAYTLTTENDPTAIASINVFQYLQGKIPGLLIYNTGLFYIPLVSYRMGTPVFFLDEVRVDAQTLLDVNMEDIAMVKVFRPPFFGAFGGANGAIAVYTKHGDEVRE